MKSLLYIFLSITLSGLLTTPMPVLAKTPDGDTPANEGVCDDLKAASVTKGLYGLCVAFCEAHDAADISEAISSDDLAELLASRPNGKILANYNEKKLHRIPTCLASWFRNRAPAGGPLTLILYFRYWPFAPLGNA